MLGRVRVSTGEAQVCRGRGKVLWLQISHLIHDLSKNAPPPPFTSVSVGFITASPHSDPGLFLWPKHTMLAMSALQSKDFAKVLLWI